MLEQIINSIITLDEQINYDTLELQVAIRFSNNSLAFSGHFERFPVLAGAYQLCLFKHFASKLLKSELITEQIVKVRLADFVKPDDEISIKLKITPNIVKSREFKVFSKLIKNKKRVTTATMILNKSD